MSPYPFPLLLLLLLLLLAPPLLAAALPAATAGELVTLEPLEPLSVPPSPPSQQVISWWQQPEVLRGAAIVVVFIAFLLLRPFRRLALPPPSDADADLATTSPPRVVLTALEGGESRELSLPLLLGYAIHCDWPLPAAAGVAKRHARIERQGVQVVVEDLGSGGVTLVNGGAVEGVQAVVSGDRIQVGDLLFEVRLLEG